MSAASVVQVGDRLAGAGRELVLAADFAVAARIGFERLAARGSPAARIAASRFARIEDAANELREEIDGLVRAVGPDVAAAYLEIAGDADGNSVCSKFGVRNSE
jgi:hypothetical protein